MIEIKHLSKDYKNQKALKDIHLNINKGEIIGLLGPNGAGKSTLMKCIAGVENPTEGKIYLDGENIEQNTLKYKSKIGYLPENNPLYVDMYVREYLNFVCNIRKVSTKKIDEVIEKVKLKDESNKKIKELSKGYKQRVGLAQAILSDPEILILDEPTNGLDPNQILEIRDLVRTIGKDKTIIISTHIMQEVNALCQRVVLLNKGNKIADQTVQEFQGNYKSLEQAFYQLTH